MLRYLYADQLHHHPTLARAMFRDRADQFKTRLGWDVTVDAFGEERDAYDDCNPLYVIWETPQGGHGGSMRFLPACGSGPHAGRWRDHETRWHQAFRRRL